MTTPLTSSRRPGSAERGLLDQELPCAWRSGIFSVIAVSIRPGATALTLMFLEPNSFATDFAKPSRPALEAA